MTQLALDLAVAFVCLSALFGLRMWLNFKREKFTHEPIAKLEEDLRLMQSRILHVEAKLAQPRRVG